MKLKYDFEMMELDDQVVAVPVGTEVYADEQLLADLVRLNGGRVLPQARASAAANVLLNGLNDD